MATFATNTGDVKTKNISPESATGEGASEPREHAPVKKNPVEAVPGIASKRLYFSPSSFRLQASSSAISRRMSGGIGDSNVSAAPLAGCTNPIRQACSI